MKNNKQPFFLLGGRDLEMCTIQTLLETHGLPYADGRLQWHNACLSAYASELEEYGGPASPWQIYGVELQEDIPLPANYTRIDHHNRYAGLPSALEQVAALLQLPLDRRLRLIAANDRAYIPGMQALDATADEIATIRSADRRAQGVTEEDEKLAEQAIARQREERGGLVVVQALSPRFSPICDRLYPYRRLLIHTAGEWMYYGEGAARVKALFEEEFLAGRLFCGGGERGFVGARQGAYTPLEIQTMLEQIRKEMTYEHSYHIFYFPFKWKRKGESRKDFSQIIDLDNIRPVSRSRWKTNHAPGEEEQQQLYNEKNYFYEFVHPVLYDTHTRGSLVKHFEREEPQRTGGCRYRIVVKGKTYELDLDAVNLNFYATGVGTLSFYLKNERYDKPEDILKINQYGRRVFPPFYADIQCKAETADSLSLTGLAGDPARYHEDFSAYAASKKNWQPARFIRSLIADLQPGLEVTPVIDDRMFVNCWYENDDVARQFYHKEEEAEVRGQPERVVCRKQREKLEDFIYDRFWYKYLYVDDQTLTCTDIGMRKRLIDESTYTRWQHAGTLFGCTRYSLVLLTHVDSFPQKVLAVHMRTMYSRMIELVLVQRASMLKFSEEVTRVSSLSGSSRQDIAFRIGTLYKEYIRFINQMFFKDITAQDQGIELYRMLMERFRSDAQVKDLDDEIGELHQYITLLIDNSRNAQGAWLNLIATIFLPGALISGLFGMNPFDDDFNGMQFGIQCGIIAACTLLVGIILNRKKYE